METTWLNRVRHRLSSAWDVLTGRAYAGYSVPDMSGEIALRIASLHFLGEFDAFWTDKNVKYPNAEAHSYLRASRDNLESALGSREIGPA